MEERRQQIAVQLRFVQEAIEQQQHAQRQQQGQPQMSSASDAPTDDEDDETLRRIQRAIQENDATASSSTTMGNRRDADALRRIQDEIIQAAAAAASSSSVHTGETTDTTSTSTTTTTTTAHTDHHHRRNVVAIDDYSMETQLQAFAERIRRHQQQQMGKESLSDTHDENEERSVESDTRISDDSGVISQVLVEQLLQQQQTMAVETLTDTDEDGQSVSDSIVSSDSVPRVPTVDEEMDDLDASQQQQQTPRREAPWVEAELVPASSLAKSPSPLPDTPPPLYRIGVDLEREAHKTTIERRTADDLARRVTAATRTRQRTLREMRESMDETLMTTNTTTTAFSSSVTVPPSEESVFPSYHREDSHEADPDHGGLTQAADTGKRRLETLHRTREILLEMQAEMDAIRDRLQQRRRRQQRSGDSGKGDGAGNEE